MAKYINRDAYIRYLSSRKAEFVDDFGQGWCAGIDTAISACEKFPAADVEPVRHGHWIVKETAAGALYTVCSHCNASVKYNDEYGTVVMNLKGANYCPNCGAKMDEEVSE